MRRMRAPLTEQQLERIEAWLIRSEQMRTHYEGCIGEHPWCALSAYVAAHRASLDAKQRSESDAAATGDRWL